MGWFLVRINLRLEYCKIVFVLNQIIIKLLISDSETAFLFFENLFRVICLCLLILFLFIVCRFVRLYPIVFVCGVITRSFF